MPYPTAGTGRQAFMPHPTPPRRLTRNGADAARAAHAQEDGKDEDEGGQGDVGLGEDGPHRGQP